MRQWDTVWKGILIEKIICFLAELERVGAPGVTVVDNGTISNRRGSLNVDDEGNTSQNNVLIEDGILRGYMQDRLIQD